MRLTAISNKIGLSVRGLKDGKSFFDEKLLQLTGLEHFAHDVASADEFALDVELRDRGPVGVDLDSIPQCGRVVHIERLVSDPDVFEDLDQMTRKSALWKLWRALHEEHDVVRPYFILNELFDAHYLISVLFRYRDDGHHIMKLQSASGKKKLVLPAFRSGRGQPRAE